MPMKSHGFYPTEIIFSATNACNLHCEHCFVGRNPHKLEIKDAISLIENCVQYGGQPDSKGNPLPVLERVGFSGGEPFLYMDFLLQITKACLDHDLLFDQIMTNGDWWKDESELCEKLQTLYDAGYDGKIGLSWDSYHGQKTTRMQTFITKVQEIFGPTSINIQTVSDKNTVGEASPSLQPEDGLALPPQTGGKTAELFTPRNAPLYPNDIPVYRLNRTFTSEDSRAWQTKHWFKDDYCEGPGQILYVHANGNIAPCCGFANENPALFIGTIHDSLETIMQKAATNPMIKICYQEGLAHYRKKELKKSLRAKKQKLPGKCGDICSFCDFVCKEIIL